MSNDSWYSRALQRASGQPSAAAPQQQARYAPQAQPQYGQGHSQLSTPGVQQQPMAIPDEMMPAEMRWANKLVGAARNALQRGVAHRTDVEPCPQCGSNQFFSRGTTNKRMPPPAPHCYNCGYNDGMFEQGLESSWVGAQP